MLNKKLVIIISCFAILALMVSPGISTEKEMELEYKLSSGVEVVDLSTEMATHEKLSPDKPCLYLALTLKNVSDKESRYSVYLILPEENKSVGGIMPRKGDPLAPGETISQKYPLVLYEDPSKVTIIVETMK